MFLESRVPCLIAELKMRQYDLFVHVQKYTCGHFVASALSVARIDLAFLTVVKLYASNKSLLSVTTARCFFP